MSYQHINFDVPGTPDVLQLIDSSIPEPSATQVLIKVAYAGVNGPDIAQRKGLYPAPRGASLILGLEVSGEVVAIGEQVTEWQIGDKVCALVPGGGYGEYVLTQGAHCLPIPHGVTLQQAACLPETFFTVWGNLFIRGGLKAGETVLIHGGSGGIGSAAIVLAKSFGARVITTSSSDEKCQYCKELGSDHAINSQEQCFVEQSKSFTQGKGVDLVLDMVGGDYINRNLKSLALDGRLISIAMQSDPCAQVDIARIMSKRLIWTGSTLRPQGDDAKSEIAAQLLEQVWPRFINEPRLQPNIFKAFSLQECVAAHRLMESGEHRGKIVLKVN